MICPGCKEPIRFFQKTLYFGQWHKRCFKTWQNARNAREQFMVRIPEMKRKNCGTHSWMAEKRHDGPEGRIWSRSNNCYEAEIAHLQAAVVEARGILIGVFSGPKTQSRLHGKGERTINYVGQFKQWLAKYSQDRPQYEPEEDSFE